MKFTAIFLAWNFKSSDSEFGCVSRSQSATSPDFYLPREVSVIAQQIALLVRLFQGNWLQYHTSKERKLISLFTMTAYRRKICREQVRQGLSWEYEVSKSEFAL